jgi:hypothetical protein
MIRRLRPDPAILRRIAPRADAFPWRLHGLGLELQPATVRTDQSIRSTWLRLSEADRPKLAARRSW